MALPMVLVTHLESVRVHVVELHDVVACLGSVSFWSKMFGTSGSQVVISRHEIYLTKGYQTDQELPNTPVWSRVLGTLGYRLRD